MISNFIEVPSTVVSLRKRRLVYGVGINDSEYLVTLTENNKIIDRCPFYKTWANMLSRCYCHETKKLQPVYIGCSVCEEWLVFSKFKSWMVKQDWQEKYLDKDLKIEGNREYSPDACVFVSGSLNSVLAGTKLRGKYPAGVSLDKKHRQYRAMGTVNGKRYNLGYFKTQAGANAAYINFKTQAIEVFILEYPELKEGLESVIKSLREGVLK